MIAIFFLGMMNSFQGCGGREPLLGRQGIAPGKAGSGAELVNRAPAEAQRSGFGGKRRSSGESEFRPGGRNEGCGACDNATVQEQGVSKILTINLNDMAKELKIK